MKILDEHGQLNTGFVKVILFAFIAVIIFSFFVQGDSLNCSIIQNNSCAETAILHIQNDTGGYWNAHAQNASVWTYSYTLCCDANDAGDIITANCNDVTMLKLSDTTNAHVQQPSVNTYSVDACISADTGKVTCNYRTGSCSAGETCMLSMASDPSEANNTNAHVGDCNEYETLVCCTLGIAPPTITPIINSTDPTLNRTAQGMECSFIPLDDNPGETLYANITWYKNGLTNTTNSSIEVTNGTQYLDMLNSDYTDKADNWSCAVEICDSIGLCNNPGFSYNMTILNTPPSATTLSLPALNNLTYDRTPNLEWNTATDADGDSLTYQLNVDCKPACSADDRIISNIDGTSKVIPTELNYFDDNGDFYEWFVAAYDNEDYGDNSSLLNFSIQTQVIISLPTDFMNFGTKNIGDTDDTTDNTPSPLVVQNDGNCNLDINLSADSLLWVTQPSASSAFQYKIDNITGEEGAFNWTSSDTTWTNVPQTNLTSISKLNHTDSTDSAEIEINIDVPLAETAGAKNSLLQFTGRYVKIT